MAYRKPDPGYEGEFYASLAEQLACRTPALLRRGGGPGRDERWLELENLPPARPAHQWTPADLLSGARMLALVHGRFWELTALSEERPWLPVHAPADGPVALCHGDYRPGHIHMSEDGTKWVISWGRAHLGDPAQELVAYARHAATLQPRLRFDGVLSAYLEILSDRLEVEADPAWFEQADRRSGRDRRHGPAGGSPRPPSPP